MSLKSSISSTESLFRAFLDRHDDAAWSECLDRLEASIHPVDQRAVRIWFAFFPLSLHRSLSNSTDVDRTIVDLRLSGRFRLDAQVDSSHSFLYGHRFWPEVKQALNAFSAGSPQTLRLNEQILELARQTASRLKVEPSLLVAITAVAFMTFQQVGHEVFREPAEKRDYTALKMSPEQLLASRAEDDSQGILGFLRTIDRQFTVTFVESSREASFKAINDQELTTAAALDKRDYRSLDPRCIEGPIPVECRTAACGTCWVGVLSEGEKLSSPSPREISRMRDFGYHGFTGRQNSPIRLACQTRARGNVSIVIPPWNGFLGKAGNTQ